MKAYITSLALIVCLVGEVSAQQYPLEQNWTIVQSPSPSTIRNMLRGVAAISTNDVWAVGVHDVQVGSQTQWRTLIEHYNGLTWSVVSSPNPGSQYNDLWSVTAAGTNDVWAVGFSAGIPATPQPLALRWNGTQWNVVPTPTFTGGSDLYDVAIVGPNDVWVVGDRAVGAPGPTIGTLALHWSGSQWQEVPTPNVGDRSNFLNALGVVSQNNIWAVGYYKNVGDVFRSLIGHWDGSSWSVVAGPILGDQTFLYDVTVVSSNDVWAVGLYNNGGTDVPYSLHWDGSSWSVVNNPGGGSGIAKASSVDMWSVGTCISHWDGSAWTLVSSPLPPGGNLLSVFTISSAESWAVGRYPGSNGYLETMTMRYDAPTSVGGDGSMIASSFRLDQNYPNPFNPSTTIRFQIPQPGLVSLKVFDVLGREVASLVNEPKEPGSYSVRWDATTAGSGTYFARLESNGRHEIRKMLLMK